MADQKVNINIGTSYSGEGMQRAMGAMNNMSRVAGKAAGAVGSIGGALGGMSGEAGKAIGSISRLIGALAMGGPLGLAIAGVTALVGAFQSLREEEEKTRQEQERMRFESAKRHIDSYQESVNALATSLEKVTKFQATFNNTLAAIDTNRANVQATQALITGEKGGTAVSRAEGQRNATAITQAQNIQNAETALRTAQKNWGNANKAAEAQAKAIAGLEKYVESAQQNLNKVIATTDPEDEEGIAARRRAATILSKSQQALADAKDKERDMTNAALQAYNEYVKTLEALNATKAKAELENVRAENAVVDAKKKAEEDRLKEEQKRRDEEEKEWEEEERSRQEAIKETWEQVTREKERNDRFREEERMEKKLREEIAKEPQLREELNKATEDLKNAERELATRMRNVQLANMGWRGPMGWGGGGGDGNAPIGEGQVIGNGINGKNRYDPRNNQSIHDAGYNRRKQAGYARNAQSQGFGNSARDAADLRDMQGKLERAAARGEDVMTKEGRDKVLGKGRSDRYDKLFAKDPENMKEIAKIAGEKAAQKLKDAKDAKDQAEQQLQANVQTIVTLMKNLGLK